MAKGLSGGLPIKPPGNRRVSSRKTTGKGLSKASAGFVQHPPEPLPLLDLIPLGSWTVPACSTFETYTFAPLLMKPFSSYPLLLLLVSFSGLASLSAQEKPVVPAQTPSANPPTASASARVTEEKTTTVAFPDPNLDKLEGKVVRIDGETKQLLLRTKNGKEPIPYGVNAATRFVDLDGLPVNPSLIIAEVPVEVRYVEKGPDLIASTVIVQRYQTPVPGGGVNLTTRETLKAGGKVVEETTKTTTETARTGTTSTTRSGTMATMENGVLTVIETPGSTPLRYQYSETTQWVNANGEPLPAAMIKPGYAVKVIYSQRGGAVFADRIVVTPAGSSSTGGGALPAPSSAPGALLTPVPNTSPR